MARITAIADSFDAMTSKRTYRDSLPLETVISEFERCKGTQFDPQLTDIFLDILKNHCDEKLPFFINGNFYLIKIFLCHLYHSNHINVILQKILYPLLLLLSTTVP